MRYEERESLTESKIDTLKSLLKLRDIDEKLHHLNKRMEDGPRILGKRSAESSEVENAVAAKKDEITKLKIQIKNSENELQIREDGIKKQELHLLSAKTNQEYKGHQDEIARFKNEISNLEEDILRAFEEVEEKNGDLSRLNEDLMIHKNELAEFKGEIDAEVAEYAAEIDQLMIKREESKENIQFEAMQVYEKVRNAREGMAVSCADGKMCHGCFMTITANDMQRLLNCKELVTCKSCQRILYLSDTLS